MRSTVRGMPIEIRTPTEDDLPAMFRRDEEAFGGLHDPTDREVITPLLPLERFRIAVDGPDLVGVVGSFAKTVTLPGGGPVPVGGTTWVSVAPSHRRRGLLGRLMDDVHDDMRDRGDVAAALLASEAGIYERYGYGVATRWRVVEIDRRRASLQERFVPADPGVRIVDPDEHVDRLADLFDRHQRSRVGEVSRTHDWWRGRLRQDQPGVRCALHEDGFALWKITPDWGEGEPNHELRVIDLVAATAAAHVALWHTVLSHDLVGPIRARTCVSIDDPLPFLLTDPRALRTVAYTDMLWICPFDVGVLLDARAYRVDDSLVVALVDGDLEPVERWRVSPSGSVRTDDAPDLRVTRGALGALLLGGVTATELAAGRRVVGDAASLRRADVLFGWAPVAHCSTSF